MSKMSRTSRRRASGARHRHIVAAPIAVLIVGISLLDGSLPVAPRSSAAFTASVVESSEGTVLDLPGGLQAVLYSGEGFDSSEEGVTFRGGSALVASDGIALLTVAGRKLTAVSGAFYLSYRGNSITVAAVTSPVAVRKGSRLMVVPVGMQWRTSADTELPLLQAGYPLWLRPRNVQAFSQSFLARELRSLALLPQRDLLPPARSSNPPPLWTTLPRLRIGASKADAERSWQTEALGTLRGLIASGDADAVATFFRDGRYAETITSREAVDLSARLLAKGAIDSSVRSLLLQQLISDEDLWMVSSLHPDLREETWSLFPQQTNAEAALLRLFLLPLSNITADAVSPSILQRWGFELSRLERGEASIPLVHAILKLHLPLVSRFERDGYPERSRMLARVLLKLVEDTGAPLPKDLAGEFTVLKTLGRIDVQDDLEPIETPQSEESMTENVSVGGSTVEEVPGAATDVEASSEASSYSPDVIEDRTYAALREIGALFTVETRISAVAPSTAQVQGIVFSTPRGDVSFDLQFDVERGEIDRISVGGREYPYALSVQAFLEWVSR